MLQTVTSRQPLTKQEETIFRYKEDNWGDRVNSVRESVKLENLHC
jgi:hypothetical protein